MKLETLNKKSILKNFAAGNFTLESGTEIKNINIAYHVFGDFSENKKVIWICHALTANSDAQDWWPNFIGENFLLNPETYTIVCANVLGSCYGTTFECEEKRPLISIRDIVEMHKKLAKFLKISEIELLLGGSLGGMQCLEWAISEPDFIKNLFVIATNAKHSSWGIAFNEAQRMALNLGEKGIDAARAIAMLSYRNYITFEETQNDDEDKLNDYKAATYQQYQGEKLRKRFSADSYYMLSKAMDTNNVGRGRISVENALSKISAKTLVVGIDSDILFPIHEQKRIAENIKNAKLEVISSLFGHDGFLLEIEKITQLLIKHFDFLKKKETSILVEK